jgi:hypothetical protein
MVGGIVELPIDVPPSRKQLYALRCHAVTPCGHRVRFVATWREEFFEVPLCLLLVVGILQGCQCD